MLSQKSLSEGVHISIQMILMSNGCYALAVSGVDLWGSIMHHKSQMSSMKQLFVRFRVETTCLTPIPCLPGVDLGSPALN